MGHTEDEITDQPACWRAALDLAATAPAGLPAPAERVAVVGCGTSLYVARTYAALREAAGHGETDAWPASEYRHRRYDRVLALSRSGTTTEVLDLLRALPPGTASTAITADPDSPIAAAVRHVVPLRFADEHSVVQTRFPTALLVLLRAHLGEDLTALPAAAAAALTAPLPRTPRAVRQFTFLGIGWAAGVAAEAALKLREAAGAWAEAYPAMEYRHGPIAVADESSLVWFLGAAPDGLVEQVRRTGATVEASGADPLVELVRAQRLAVEVARERGLDPDHPRGLARSIVLR